MVNEKHYLLLFYYVADGRYKVTGLIQVSTVRLEMFICFLYNLLLDTQFQKTCDKNLMRPQANHEKFLTVGKIFSDKKFLDYSIYICTYLIWIFIFSPLMLTVLYFILIPTKQ